MMTRRQFLSAAAATSCLGLPGCLPADDDITLQGSGATFPTPLYKRWFLEYYRAHPEVRINYTPIGSGAGIRQFTAGLVSFGASDAGMSKKEIDKLPPDFDGVRLLPMTAGSIVLSYNLPGVAETVRLSRKAYLGILLREITDWDDAEIAKCNPGTRLPSMPVTVVTRADSSGTTYAFTNHLAAVGKAIGMPWAPGVDKSVRWPESIAAQGNDGVAALIQLTPGAVGYLEFGYAELAHLPMAALENKAGRYITAGQETGRKALEGATIPPDLQIKVPDPADAEAYPIVTYTWLLCRGRYRDLKEAETLQKVIAFGLDDGQRISADLGYIPLPPDVVQKVRAALDTIRAEP
jgi:phosphate transport system substrate-binding protein